MIKRESPDCPEVKWETMWSISALHPKALNFLEYLEKGRSPGLLNFAAFPSLDYRDSGMNGQIPDVGDSLQLRGQHRIFTEFPFNPGKMNWLPETDFMGKHKGFLNEKKGLPGIIMLAYGNNNSLF